MPSLDLILIDCLLENLKVLYDPATQRYAIPMSETATASSKPRYILTVLTVSRLFVSDAL